MCSRRYGLPQFPFVRGQGRVYDVFMNFTFLTSDAGLCRVKLWATGRYGFSLPKKVEITTPAGETCTFIYHNRKVGLRAELRNRVLVRIAIAQFMRQPGLALAGPELELDDAVAPFDGELTPARLESPRQAASRVRPGRAHARARPLRRALQGSPA